MLARKVDVIKRRGREKEKSKRRGKKKKMSAGTPGIAATQKGKIQWWGAAYENIRVVRRSTEEYRLPGMFQLQITEIGRKQGIP
jgi:hypothetical protein